MLAVTEIFRKHLFILQQPAAGNFQSVFAWCQRLWILFCSDHNHGWHTEDITSRVSRLRVRPSFGNVASYYSPGLLSTTETASNYPDRYYDETVAAAWLGRERFLRHGSASDKKLADDPRRVDTNSG
jgi:hypothetical protein